ncbi:MAG: inositol monophosphatase [Burkholderiaceae bacterium]|nr:inositol monophosphatase [Burkholderiaceae bacterium]
MIPTQPQLDQTADLLLQVADAEILPRFRRLGPEDIRSKTSATDLVTVADEAAERVLTRELRLRFPDALVIGEEAVSADPSLLDALDAADFAITIDPVDGTRNFAAGLAVFAVMVGFLAKGRPVAGIVCDPVVRDWAMAREGHGAWLRHGDGTRERLRVAAPKPVEAMEGCGLWAHMHDEGRAAFAQRLTRCAGTSAYRCAGQECRAVASGRFDFVLYHKLTPWDHVPCVLLHREAGGYVAHHDGAPYDPSRRDGGILYAADRECWEAIRQALLA